MHISSPEGSYLEGHKMDRVAILDAGAQYGKVVSAYIT